MSLPFTLFLTWVIFSGYTTPFFLLLGVCSTAIVAGLSYRLRAYPPEHLPLWVRLSTYRYVAWIMKEMLRSSIAVARCVWSGSITPALIKVPVELRGHGVKALYANSITLTPGTVCVEMGERTAEVHCLTKSGVQDIKSGRMEKRIAYLEGIGL